MLKIANLIVMQEYVRNTAQITQMTDFARTGGVFSNAVLLAFATSHGLRVSPIIHIARFPDGLFYIHDGHHRIRSVWKSGRDHLYDEEYYIKNWKYEDYLEINIPNGWFTSFDPRTEVRLPDFGNFKNSIRKLIEEKDDYAKHQTEIEQHILSRKKEYATKRTIMHVNEMHDEELVIETRR